MHFSAFLGAILVSIVAGGGVRSDPQVNIFTSYWERGLEK